LTVSLPGQSLSAHDVTRLLDFEAAPRKRTFPRNLARRTAGGRAPSTAIYFLLARGERSHWHRIDAVEVWNWYAGAPLNLEIAQAAGRVDRGNLGSDPAPAGCRAALCWQAAQTLGNWTLCGCTVAPGFDFATFELAPSGWEPK
jgi:uncharacterized protein